MSISVHHDGDPTFDSDKQLFLLDGVPFTGNYCDELDYTKTNEWIKHQQRPISWKTYKWIKDGVYHRDDDLPAVISELHSFLNNTTDVTRDYYLNGKLIHSESEFIYHTGQCSSPI